MHVLSLQCLLVAPGLYPSILIIPINKYGASNFSYCYEIINLHLIGFMDVTYPALNQLMSWGWNTLIVWVFNVY